MSFTPTHCTIVGESVYLNGKSNYYTIDVSPSVLGSAYTPDPNDPYNEPGTWNIQNIFAGLKPDTGIVPSVTFSLGQQLVTFYIQNIGGVPIIVNLLNNDSTNNYTYFSFGVPPNQTPSSYTLTPLSILIIQTVFTSNNVIRFYNSFLDSLNYDQLYRTFDQAFQVGYYDTGSKSENTIVGGPHIYSQVLSSDETISLDSLVTSYAQLNLTTQEALTLTLDGTDIPGDSTMLIVITTNADTTLKLVNLVGTDNYLDQPFPTLLQANTTWFVVLNNTRAVAYDGTGSTGTASTTVAPAVITFDRAKMSLVGSSNLSRKISVPSLFSPFSFEVNPQPGESYLIQVDIEGIINEPPGHTFVNAVHTNGNSYGKIITLPSPNGKATSEKITGTLIFELSPDPRINPFSTANLSAKIYVYFI